MSGGLLTLKLMWLAGRLVFATIDCSDLNDEIRCYTRVVEDETVAMRLCGTPGTVEATDYGYELTCADGRVVMIEGEE